MHKLIVGLGNPEPRFKLNRHNIGFMMIDALADYHKANSCMLRRHYKPALSLRYFVSTAGFVFLLKPLDWMNSSGRSVGTVARELQLKPEDIMVIHDDMDFEFSRIKIKAGGNSGRHNGVQSVIDAIGKNFARFRVGIGRPDEDCTARDHVLSDFRTWEQKHFCELFGLGIQVVNTFVAHNVQRAMSTFNRREVDDGRDHKEA